MAWFLLVPGACHGGWWLEPLAERLRAAGHRADAVTLAGLDPDAPPADPGINLDTHVSEVVELLKAGTEPAVLVGHSYAGSVITAAADALPDRVAALVYVDAFVPADGDSCWSMTNDEQRAWYGSGAGETGLAVAPLPFFDQRARPQPIGTFLQRTRLSGRWTRVPDKHYLLAGDDEWRAHSPFVRFADELRTEPGWRVVDLDATHNVLARGTDDMLAALLAVVG